MKLNVVIVDDEPPARERIRALLAQEPDVEILAECDSGAEALAALRKRDPDLLFLDVQMPEMSGFELLQKLPAPWPAIIFVTAFNQHAVAAFEVRALDYLLKPFTAGRFRAAVARARDQLAQKTYVEAAQRLHAWLDAQRAGPPRSMRLAVRDRDRTRFLNVSDIDWIEASGNYVVIHVGLEKHVLRESLTSLESQFPADDFFRINRRTLVRLDAIAEVVAVERDQHVAVLKGGERLPLRCGVREIVARMIG
jgi:two-component system LytT family response regulator